MKKLFVWIVRIAVLVVLVKVVLWSWDQYQGGGSKKGMSADDVLDFDKVCRITNPDYGSCVCLHRQTNERLEIPYEECVQRARNPNN